MYSEKLLQYFKETNHGGELLQGNDVILAQEGSAEEGRWVIFSLKLIPGEIPQVRYQVQGCPVMIACAEYVAQAIAAKTIAEWQQLSGEKLISILDIPSHKYYCAMMLEDVITQLAAKHQ